MPKTVRSGLQQNAKKLKKMPSGSMKLEKSTPALWAAGFIVIIYLIGEN